MAVKLSGPGVLFIGRIFINVSNPLLIHSDFMFSSLWSWKIVFFRILFLSSMSPNLLIYNCMGFHGGSVLKNLPVMQEMCL